MSRTKYNRTTPTQFDFDYEALDEAFDDLLFEFTMAITTLKKKISGNFSLAHKPSLPRARAHTRPHAVKNKKQKNKNFAKTKKQKIREVHNHLRRKIPSKYIKLSGLFLHYQQRNWPQYLKEVTEKQILQGAIQLERLVQIDGFEFDVVKNALRWLTKQPNHFWCRNLRSLSSVRKECSDGITKFVHILSAYDEASKELKQESEIRSAPFRYYRSLPDAVKDKFKYSGGITKLIEQFENYCERIGIHDPNPKALQIDGKLWLGFIREKERQLGISFKTGRPK